MHNTFIVYILPSDDYNADYVVGLEHNGDTISFRFPPIDII